MSKLSVSKPELAAEFINSTSQNIFLTGKAGTGKTTFLRKLPEITHKSFLIVAPTGIAALNAGGVTIHSQFLLPFGTYLVEPVDFHEAPGLNFYGRKELGSRHTLNKARKEVLRKIELLVIDEVSMLRADVLDAIDYRLRAARGNFSHPFGGVQLLLIGDLHQLPPIVKDQEWRYLRDFYANPYFYEARALKESGLHYLEFDVVYRQADERFISILNNLRENCCSTADIEFLNSYYRPDYEVEEGVITLCTHNHQAEEINRRTLEQLPGDTETFDAEVKNDFPESMYPVDKELHLKIGTQIMFIKNDSQHGLYYNGKLARVVAMEDGEITVELDNGGELSLERHEWENKKYTIDPESKELKEEVLGVFRQYPVKLAWAVTVHKSQGLTFDKAYIDIGNAFAAGQVYVALSRLRSLQGLILRRPISSRVIMADQEVVNFAGKHRQKDLHQALDHGRQWYLYNLFEEAFDVMRIASQVEYQLKRKSVRKKSDDLLEDALPFRLLKQIQDERHNSQVYIQQLRKLVGENDSDKLLERLRKGSDYYRRFLEDCLKEVLLELALHRSSSRTKTYRNLLEEIDQIIDVQLECIEKISHISRAIVQGENIGLMEDLRRRKEERRLQLIRKTEEQAKGKAFKKSAGKKGRQPKGTTYLKTYELLRQGLSPEAVAEKRALALSTIQTHIARGIKEGALLLENFMQKDRIESISLAINKHSDSGLKEVYAMHRGEYTYSELHMVNAHLSLQEEPG